MNIEERMASMEASQKGLQGKFEKLETDMKKEISQAQCNIVGQIALMMGLPDPN